jgi:hypothetical protein
MLGEEPVCVIPENQTRSGRLWGYWASADSGHPAAAPLISVMNCRRFMGFLS